MFMYKEDCDLAERLVAIGKSCLYVSGAILWHNRTASANLPRAKRSERERIGSAAHHGWIIAKHWRWFPWHIRIRILFREFLRQTFLLLFEPSIFFRARKITWEQKEGILERRRKTQHLVPFLQFDHLYHEPKSQP